MELRNVRLLRQEVCASCAARVPHTLGSTVVVSSLLSVSVRSALFVRWHRDVSLQGSCVCVSKLCPVPVTGRVERSHE